ncbi:MAG: indole-3-glycerol phosphate synthase TrpC [Planctomycetota bacterium]
MRNILDEILANKHIEVEQLRVTRPLTALKSLAGYALPRRNFFGAVSVPRRGRPNLIAEIKQSSPSAGLIRPDLDPVILACQYAAAEADALSILTDTRYFGGQIEYIERIKSTVGLPVLRKDFLFDSYQLHESRAYGADAVLLIADALTTTKLVELVDLAAELDLCVLVEVHEHNVLVQTLLALDVGRRSGLLLGINNRDLKRQVVDLATTEKLAPLIPPGTPLVAESGIKTRQDVRRMHTAGARALLVGEALIRANDPESAIRELFS